MATTHIERVLDPFARLNGFGKPEQWHINGLNPLPEEEWARMREFLALSDAEMTAMLSTVEALFRRGHELVVATYDYLLRNHETAAILGWENGADPEHLSERRRFFTVWLARLLGMDFSNDLAHYLFRAGKLHAAHGPRRAHVPPIYVTGSISLVNGAFARFIMEELPGHTSAPLALAGWNKVLTLHLHLMQLGYEAALALDHGEFDIPFVLFGRMRNATGVHSLIARVETGAPVESALRKFFNYYPASRAEVFDLAWAAGERLDSHGTPWFVANQLYAVKPMWRVLLNGKDLSYIGGPDVKLNPGDEIHIFPPGR
jgi:molybdopterin converting factor small subunit